MVNFIQNKRFTEAEGKRFMRERNKRMKRAKQLLKPTIDYAKDYDIIYIGFRGNSRIDSTVEITPDFRVDITKDGIIVGIEIENFSEHQKKGKI